MRLLSTRKLGIPKLVDSRQLTDPLDLGDKRAMHVDIAGASWGGNKPQDTCDTFVEINSTAIQRGGITYPDNRAWGAGDNGAPLWRQKIGRAHV